MSSSDVFNRPGGGEWQHGCGQDAFVWGENEIPFMYDSVNTRLHLTAFPRSF